MQSLIFFATTCLALATANPLLKQGDIYAGCGEAKNCWGVNADGGPCVETMDCNLVVSWVNNGGAYDFELQSANAENAWVALGFSRDGEMGDDSVVICDAMNGATDLYWNVAESEEVKYPLPVGDNTGLTAGSSNNDNGVYCSFTQVASLTFLTPVDPAEEDNTGLTAGSSNNDNGVYCSFTQVASLTFLTPVDPAEEVTFDLDSESFYLLLSSGQLDADGVIDQHNAIGVSEGLWAGLSSLNELPVHAVAMEKWRAFHSQDGPDGSRNALGQVLFPSNVATRSTRSETAGVVSPHLPYAANTLVDNGIAMWNKFPALREASTKRMASSVAKPEIFGSLSNPSPCLNFSDLILEVTKISLLDR
eukprot:maker-scaffold1093_size63167-snap-gene-0.14 protein:Tk03946 transcript:maker-scaffold1093_size63167-snap-gene-0.14-mRNA-1 annotation:"ferric-chelate reductase 1 homolog isoform x1"